MKPRLFLVGLALLPGMAQAQELTVSHHFGGPVDGTALGDVDGDTGLELAVITRQGTDAAMLSVFDDEGTELLAVRSDVPLGGFPVLADFDGDQRDEPAFCEVHAAGKCRIFDLDGSILAEWGPFYFPGMTTAGPAAADIDADGKAELIVATYGGLVAAYSLEGMLWQADTWQSHGEQFFGHPVVEDVDGDGALEVVVVGARRGHVLAFDARSGQVDWEFLDIYQKYGNYAYANGALVADMNGDGHVEVVVAMVGQSVSDAVFAFDGANGALKSRLPLPGADLAYMSPVAIDTHEAGGADVYLQGGEGILRKLGLTAGALRVTGQVGLGQASWVAPAFVDADGDGTLEVLASTTGSMVLVEPTIMSAIAVYPGSPGLLPTSVIGDVDRDGRADIVTASWWDQTLLHLELDTSGPYTWRSLGGASGRGGKLDAPWRPPGSSSLSFEYPSEWTIATGTGTLESTHHFTDGSVGMAISGGGFIEITSPVLTTEMVRQNTAGGAPGRAVLDVSVQPGQPNPHWLGAIQFYVSIPSAGLYHRYIGQESLNLLSIGEFGQISFDLPSQVEAILLSDHADVRFSIAVNTPQGAPALIIDHLRFSP